MKSIFESLQNLSISEECFNSIMNIIEEHINELEEKDIDRVVDDAYDTHNQEIEDLKRKIKPHHPDDVDTAYNNHEIRSEIGAKEQDFEKRMDKFQKNYDKWLDWKKAQKKKNN